MSSPPHPPWYNHPNNLRRRIQVMKLIIMQFSPWSIFLPFRSKYLPQHSALKKPHLLLYALYFRIKKCQFCVLVSESAYGKSVNGFRYCDLYW
jgi:hypothetical protein